MKQNIVEHISTLNYIDSWAKQVKRQAEDIKKLFSSTFGNHHQEYPYELLEIKDAINGIIDNIGYITDCIDETELLKSNR